MPIQQVCPHDVTEHIGLGVYDNTAYQIALDALTHPGSGRSGAGGRDGLS